MQIMVTIPDEIATEAQAHGLTPAGYVEKLVARQGTASQPPLTVEEKLAKLDKFFDEISANSENIPLLPDEAFTRESFYSDHD